MPGDEQSLCQLVEIEVNVCNPFFFLSLRRNAQRVVLPRCAAMTAFKARRDKLAETREWVRVGGFILSFHPLSRAYKMATAPRRPPGPGFA